jgi:hypothetical protein
MPDWLWRLNVAGMQRFFNFATIGLFDPPVRELMGYSWSPRQERLHKLFGRTVYRITKVLPERMLMHPRKRSAWTARRVGCPWMHPWCTLPPATFRRSSTATIPTTTARRSDQRQTTCGVHAAPSK